MMKNIFLLLLLLSCSTPKQYILNDVTCNYDYSITDKEKTINIKEYESLILSKQLISESDIIKNNDKENKTVYVTKDINDTIIVYKQIDKQTNIEKILKYNTKGKLLISYFMYGRSIDLSLGKDIYYNNGKVVKTIDHRQADKYPICFKEAITIVENKISKKDSIFSISRDSMLRGKSRYYWSVFVQEPNPKNSTREGKSWAYQIDAVTGKLIKKVSVVANPG